MQKIKRALKGNGMKTAQLQLVTDLNKYFIKEDI